MAHRDFPDSEHARQRYGRFDVRDGGVRQTRARAHQHEAFDELLRLYRLLEQEKVAAVPGIAFGADAYIRISYATSMANLEKGLERIERFARSLVGDKSEIRNPKSEIRNR